MTLPRYRLDLVQESPESLVYAESSNYGDAATCFVIGVVLLTVAAFAPGIQQAHRHNLSGTALAGTLLFLCGAAFYSVKSRIALDRTEQTLSIRRSLGFLTWTVRYPIDNIYSVFVDGGSKKRVRLALELKDGRYRSLTLWRKLSSLSAEEALLNEHLRRFRLTTTREATESEEWDRTRAKAAARLRRDLRRVLYVGTAFVAVVGATILLVHLHVVLTYPSILGKCLLLGFGGLWIALIVEAVAVYSEWLYVRDLRKIEKQFDRGEDS